MRTIVTLSSSKSTLVRLCYSIDPSLKIRKGIRCMLPISMPLPTIRDYISFTHKSAYRLRL